MTAITRPTSRTTRPTATGRPAPSPWSGILTASAVFVGRAAHELGVAPGEAPWPDQYTRAHWR